MVDHASTHVALALKDFNLKRTEFTNNNKVVLCVCGRPTCLVSKTLIFIRGVQSVVNIILDFEV